MDQAIEKKNCESLQNLCSGSKTTDHKARNLAKADTPWSRLHLNFAGSMNRYLVVVDSFTKFISAKIQHFQ